MSAARNDEHVKEVIENAGNVTSFALVTESHERMYTEPDQPRFWGVDQLRKYITTVPETRRLILYLRDINDREDGASSRLSNITSDSQPDGVTFNTLVNFLLSCSIQVSSSDDAS